MNDVQECLATTFKRVKQEFGNYSRLCRQTLDILVESEVTGCYANTYLLVKAHSSYKYEY